MPLYRAPTQLPGLCEGRLTTESGVAVSTSDRASQSTIYFTPYKGSRVSLYNGTRWTVYGFTERSLALSGLTGGKNYDVFLYDNAGTLTLELSAAWTNDTTRADALALQDGVLVKSGTTTRRFLGTLRASAATTTEDTGAPASGTTPKRFVWNQYNRVPRLMRAIESADSWTYDTAAWRSMNNDATNRCEYVCGQAEDMLWAQVEGIVALTAVPDNVATGVGVDSTSANSALIYGQGIPAAGATNGVFCTYEGVPGLGYHYLQALEYGSGTATNTWYGDAGVSFFQAGIVAWGVF